MSYFVNEKSIVREIWKNSDTVFLIFAGSAAEFALNKAVDWLYYTGKLPKNPLERLFTTVEFAQKIIFSDRETAYETIDQITKIHQNVEKSRKQNIPDWAYRDVLYMLIDYSIRSFELLERELKQYEKDEILHVFIALGQRMNLKNLPANFKDWEVDREFHLENNLEKGPFTLHLFDQYKIHLGSFRYFILVRMQHILVPTIVFKKLFKPYYFPTMMLLTTYKFTKFIKINNILKSLILPKNYKQELQNIGKFENYNARENTK